MPASILSTTTAASAANSDVLFSCELDADALRLEGMLTALGYTPRRVVRPGSEAAQAGRIVALDRVLRAHDVRAEQERLLAALLTEGVTNPALLASSLRVSKQTVKWLSRTLCTRCGVPNTTAFLALVLAQLDAAQD